MKGQSSLEYIMLLGIILVVTIPLFYYGISSSNELIRQNQAEDSVKTIVNTADNVYASGLGTRKIATITIPSGINSASVSENKFILNLSIFSGNSEFLDISKATLIATNDLLDRLKNKGTFHVSVENFKDSDGKIKVLLGGYCGDNICSGTENPEICNIDCDSFCPDLICDQNEDCSCSDCYGQQSICQSSKICDPSGSGQCVDTTILQCGDKICTGLVGDNCNDCPGDCPTAEGYVCCPYDPEQQYYVLWKASSCPEVPPSVSNCGDYCVYTGSYDNGWCRQSPAQCTVNNEFYKSGGDQYCSGSPTGDKCCCKT